MGLWGYNPLAKTPTPCSAPAMRASVFFTLLLSLTARPALAADNLPTLDLNVAYPELKFTRPLWMVEPPDGSRRFFVVEQRGKVLILPQDRNGAETKTFLDISNRKPYVQNEEGLL